MAILCAQSAVGTAQGRADSAQCRKRGDNSHVAMRDVFDQRNQGLYGGHRFSHRLIHFPISGNQWSTHHKPHDLFVKASTPGSDLPARNSSEAPPPVEMCVILSATPA